MQRCKADCVNRVLTLWLHVHLVDRNLQGSFNLVSIEFPPGPDDHSGFFFDGVVALRSMVLQVHLTGLVLFLPSLSWGLNIQSLLNRVFK